MFWPICFSTAVAGRLQVKLFEPSIALETAIFLDLDANVYSLRARYDISELAIVIAASLANWVRAFTLYDWAAYTYLEKHLGAKDGLRIYMGLWESFALGVLPDMKAALGITNPDDLDMAMIKTLSENYWAAIGCASNATRFNDDVYEAELSDCAYWLNMKAMLGEDLASRCRRALDERIRMCLHASGEGQPWFISADWNHRTEVLFSLAAEVSRRLGGHRPTPGPKPAGDTRK